MLNFSLSLFLKPSVPWYVPFEILQRVKYWCLEVRRQPFYSKAFSFPPQISFLSLNSVILWEKDLLVSGLSFVQAGWVAFVALLQFLTISLWEFRHSLWRVCEKGVRNNSRKWRRQNRVAELWLHFVSCLLAWAVMLSIPQYWLADLPLKYFAYRKMGCWWPLPVNLNERTFSITL